jgi:pSer/pThr/pTyr-binding forkhead associated (FHA) protein
MIDLQRPMAAKKPRRPAPTSLKRDEHTDPGGPPEAVLAQARQQSVELPGAGSEATMVYDKNAGRALPLPPQTPHLAVTAGPRRGALIPLGDGGTSIGRGEGNTVVIPDISVSRQHVRVERESGRFVLYDQGSGNGTRVNGQSVDRHPLTSGDELELGDTRVLFVDPGVVSANPLAEQAGSKSGKRIPVYFAMLFALALILGAGMLRQAQRQRAEAEAQRQRDEAAALAQQRFQEGTALLEQGKWAEARDKLKIAAELDGQDGEIGRHLDLAEAEVAREQSLAQAARDLRQEPRAQTAPVETTLPERPAGGVRPKAVPVAEPPDMQKVLEAYLAGDLGGALERAAKAQGPRGPPLLLQLRSFEAVYKDGLAKQQEKKLPDAIAALEQAEQADRLIARGKNGKLGREVHQALSSLHTQLAAQLAGSEEGLPAAAAHLRSALQEDPANEQATAGLRQIDERCKELYLRGYVSKDDDVETARSAFKLVLATLPASDPTAIKAKRWLDKLDGKVPGDE